MPTTSKLEPTWTKRVINASKKEAQKDTGFVDFSPEYISLVNGKYCIYNKAGRCLGKFDSKEEAVHHSTYLKKPEDKKTGQEEPPYQSKEIDLYANGRSAIIKKEDGKYNLYSHKGKLLGTHPTREEAVKQEQAIEISKHKASSNTDKLKERAEFWKERKEKASNDKDKAFAKKKQFEAMKAMEESKGEKKTADNASPESEKKNYFKDVDNDPTNDFTLNFPPFMAKDFKAKEVPTWKPNDKDEIAKPEGK